MKYLFGSLAFSIFLLLPSVALVQRVGGDRLVLAYLLLGSLAVGGVIYCGRNTLQQIIPQRFADLSAIGLLLILLIAFIIIFPRVNSDQPGQGSDRDDALNIAATELMAGRYLYGKRTYHGSLISPMPGAVLLALPFVLLGNSAYQNLFWLPLFYLFLRWQFTRRHAAIMLLVLILFSPTILHELITGGDFLTNAIYILLATVLTMRATRHTPRWQTILAALFLGVALSSRINYALIVPPLLAYIFYHKGQWAATQHGAAIGLAFLLVTLPFYFASPSQFAPLDSVSEIGFLNNVYPLLGTMIIPASMLLVAFICCLPYFLQDDATVLIGAAVVQLLPVLIGTGALLQSGYTKWTHFFWFGLTFLFFGTVGVYMKLVGQSTSYYQKPA